MAMSQNGYAACNRSVLHNPKVPGTQIDFPGGLRRGPAGDILLWVAEQLHKRVENGGTGYGMWGYACRDVRAEVGEVELAEMDLGDLISTLEFAPSGEPAEYDDADIGLNAPCGATGTQEGEDVAAAVSNHASGTAIDWHAPRHPLGKRNTYGSRQIVTIHQIEVETEHCVRWGGDWSRPDDMHWEVVKSETECARVLRKLRGPGYQLPRPVLDYGDEGAAVREVQRKLGIMVDGVFGRGTETAVKEFQRRSGLTVDGIVGPATWTALDREDAAEPAPPRGPGVGGEIKHVYDVTPGLKELLGVPVTPELTCGKDGRGRFNRFKFDEGKPSQGHIYWHPDVGAHAVYGAIMAKYAELKWENGPLGYPTSHEFGFEHPDRDGAAVRYRQVNFQRGFIIFNPKMGAVAYH